MFKEGINEIGLVNSIKVFSKNVSMLEEENQDFALDLIKFKITDPNTIF